MPGSRPLNPAEYCRRLVDLVRCGESGRSTEAGRPHFRPLESPKSSEPQSKPGGSHAAIGRYRGLGAERIGRSASARRPAQAPSIQRWIAAAARSGLDSSACERSGQLGP